MKININSWHYRFMMWAERTFLNSHWGDPKSLCPYFWRFMLSFVATFVGTLVLIVLTPGLLGLALVLYPIALVMEWYLGRKERKTNKEPSIFMSYLKAKKQKVCPLIEYVDE